MTKRQTIFFQILGENGWDVFDREMLLRDGRLSDEELTQVFRFLLDKGEITRIEKGKYRRSHYTDEKVIGCFLASDGAISYWSALNLHGLTEQFPNELMIQNSYRTGILKIPGMGTTFRFIKVKPEKLTGFSVHGFGNHQYRTTNLEKTIVDCFDQLKYSGGYPELIKAFARAKPGVKRMITYSRAVGNNSAIRRMAYLFELLQKPGYNEFFDFASKTTNQRYISFDPSLPPKGSFLSKNKLILNLPEEEIIDMANPLRS